MSNDHALKTAIVGRIRAFDTQPLRSASVALFATLGYTSDRTVQTNSVADFRAQFDAGKQLDHPKALVGDWLQAELLFQLTDEEIARTTSLFKDEAVRQALLQSYVFIAIELKAGDYARSKLADIARRINRVFPMPVLVLFKHGNKLSLAVVNRRLHKRDESRDVLGKVTLIQNIAIHAPHRGHVDILASLALGGLSHGRRAISSFDELHAAWEEIFNIELLNQRFYEELSNWYFWARRQVQFPADLEPNELKRNSTGIIRLLTRLIFCWFLKEKDLIPDQLFDESALARILTDLDPDSGSYHRAILQNLFFATLNQHMNLPGQEPTRKFALDLGYPRNRKEYGVKNLYRHENLFRQPDQALDLFADIPFLNGGLFACLDTDDDNGKTQYVDGFSRNPKKQAHVPNHLFLAPQHVVDLSGKDDFGNLKKKKAKVRGLLRILHDYKFTLAENTPVEQEIALDPELLGQVFENLLASYNPETGESARRQTGSFYTPRPIVEYMVDGVLKSHLADELCSRLPGTAREDAATGLDILFAYTEKEHAFTDAEADALIAAIDDSKILDPACGSGAYPMGILHKLVFVLGKLDPHNHKWHRRQLGKANAIEDLEARQTAVAAIKASFERNELDYGRKLYLIENCIYGVDIQPIAIQIAKLRFFISLVCNQKASDDRTENRNIRALPNLETRFVAADSLIALDPRGSSVSMAQSEEVKALQARLADVRHRHFAASTRDEKERLRKQDNKLRKQILAQLQALGFGSEEERERVNWNPYDHSSVACFFEPATMFGPTLEPGFDIVIGNPPYIQIQKFDAAHKKAWQAQDYKTYAATGDVYCLFYERGVRLLKAGGHLSYITSNKWMRAAYGGKLRDFFARKVSVQEVIDCGGVVVFNAAMVDTAIVRLSRQEPAADFPATVLSLDFSLQQSLVDYTQQNAITFENPGNGADSWVVMAPDRFAIKQMVETQGVPLEKWHLQINRGVLTGYNKAFYITSDERKALIDDDPASAELIVPLLRGRYVERYGTAWHELEEEKWMIATFPAFELRYTDIPKPIQKHLSRSKKELEPKPTNWKSGKWPGRKSGSYEWFEIQDSIAYHQDFRKPKIIYPNMTKYLPFFLDTADHFFINDKAFILTSEEESLPYLAAILNSSLFRCCFKENFPELMGNTYEVRKIFMDKVPIKKPDARQAALFETLVPLVQAAKRQAQDHKASDASLAADFLIQVIDACVMEVYFPQHMAEKNLAISAQVQTLLPDLPADADNSALAEAATAFHRTANASDHPIRNTLLRIPAESPDLLAVIQREGAV